MDFPQSDRHTEPYLTGISFESGTLTFVKMKPPTTNKTSNESIPVRGLPEITPTQPIITGPRIAANFPSIL